MRNFEMIFLRAALRISCSFPPVMPSPRPFSIAPATLLSALFLLCAGLAVAQQPLPIPPPPPGEAHSKNKPAPPARVAVDVPILDTPPSLALPKPRQAKPEPTTKPASDKKVPGAAPSQPVPLPSLRPVPPTLPAAAPEANDSSTSIHGQFVVHGADLESRTYITQVCEEVAEEMTVLLRDPEPFGIPIVVSVKTRPNVTPGGPAVSTDIAQLAYGGFRLQITIQVRPDFNVNDFRAELARMLIAQRILRSNKELTTQRTRILPDWLLVGVKEALRYRSRSRPSAVFASVFRSGKIYGIEEILETTPGSLDALSRTLYETSCCALVLTLLDQPEGNLRMAKFLHGLASDSKSDREMLNRWFPGLNASKSSLNKWWSLQLASLATPTVFESLGPSETAKELDAALQLHYQTTPADAPVVRLASTNDTTLNADAQKEAGKSNRPARILTNEPSTKPGDATPPKSKPDTEEQTKSKAEPRKPGKPDTEEKAKPQTEKPKAAAQSQDKPELKKEEKTADKPTLEPQAKPGFSLRNLFGFGSSTNAEEDKAKKDSQPKPEPEKDAKVEPKKEAKTDSTKEAKADSKKEAKTDSTKEAAKQPEIKKGPAKQPESKKEAPAEPKTASSQKVLPTNEASAPGSKAEAATKIADETKKQPGFFGRMFGGKSDNTPAKENKKTEPEPPADKPKTKDKSKATPKQASESDKPTAATPDASLLLRAVADATIPGLGIALDATQWLRDDQPHFTFLGFGKKKDPDAPQPAEAAPAKKDDKKAEPKKDEKPKAEEPKSPPKKERLINVTIPLSDYGRILKRSDAKIILTNTATSLASLSTKAHPLFRPLIKEYIELIADISKHKTKDADARLKALKERRDQVLAQAKAVRDHLDWYEASESNDYSGSFDDYLRLPKTIDLEIPRRADPISKLLDEVEKQAEKQAEN